MRLAILSLIGRMFGVAFKVDGFPYGAKDAAAAANQRTDSVGR